MATIDISKDIDRLRSEVDELRQDVAAYAHSAREMGLARGHDALERAERFGRHARKRVRRAEKQFSRNVEERPFVALIAAIGIGFLIAKLLDIDIGRH